MDLTAISLTEPLPFVLPSTNELLGAPTANIRHLYLHIPFCHRRCSYCDFNTYANMDDRIAAYVDALCVEIAVRGQESGVRSQTTGVRRQEITRSPAHPLTRAALRPTIFFGGGTPTMLTLPQIERVLAAASAIIPLEDAEITVEANPGTVLGGDYLRGLRSLGVNRISMGVQSLDDPTLRVLGRIHTAAEARQSYADARQAGFERINLDFMFGLPGQTAAQWDATLREIVTWGVDHFSLYSLILEESTPLYAQVTAGRVSVPDDDLAGEMYEQAMDRFGAAGYTQYEISNWAKDHLRLTIDDLRLNNEADEGDENAVRLIENRQSSIVNMPAQACHHNLAYWLNADYLACGAGAHGHRYPRRYHNILGVNAYIAAVQRGALPTAEVVELSAHDLYAETMFMGLRLNAGVGYAHFADRCGAELRAVYGDVLDALTAQGLVACDADGVRLTARGRMIGNRVFEQFV